MSTTTVFDSHFHALSHLYFRSVKYSYRNTVAANEHKKKILMQKRRQPNLVRRELTAIILGLAGLTGPTVLLGDTKLFWLNANANERNKKKNRHTQACATCPVN